MNYRRFDKAIIEFSGVLHESGTRTLINIIVTIYAYK